jgi:hypothetical protein
VDPVRNPYSPGAGSRPPALVGRDEPIDAMSVALRRLLLGSNARSQILTGLRGVGKTVMLVEFQELAEAHGYFHAHIEVTEGGTLAPDLAAALRRVLLAMDAKRRAGDSLRRAFGVLKAFSLRIPDGTELSIDVDAVSGPADSGNLGTDLAGLFVELGTAARDHRTGILLTVDELHYVDRATLEALIIGLHRASQLSLPVLVAGAGLPTLAATTGQAKAYAERLFTFPTIGSLSEAQAVDALQQPATDEGVTWTVDALAEVLRVTRCYPYFIQQFGLQAWDVADGPDTVTGDDVRRSIPLALAELDDGFFRVRAGASTRAERRYLYAMAQVGPGPVRTAEVARVLGRPPSAVTPIREALLRRSLCFVPERGRIDFTVPMFGDYMLRIGTPAAGAH